MASQPPQAVLVVEQNTAVLDLFMQTLSLAGYRVIPCADDVQAIESLRKQPPALLVLNPGPAGLPDGEVLRVLENDPLLHDVPILLCSTVPRRLDRLPIGPDWRRWGAIEKPFELEVLLDVVDALVRRAPQHEPVGLPMTPAWQLASRV